MAHFTIDATYSRDGKQGHKWHCVAVGDLSDAKEVGASGETAGEMLAFVALLLDRRAAEISSEGMPATSKPSHR